jgi:nucleoside triphosphate pyrophosphatase
VSRPPRQQSLSVADEREIKPPSLIVASGSPRRRQLLSDAGVQFAVIESGLAEEPGEDENAADYALRMAERKALAVSTASPQDLVLGADTVVECEGRILEKPADGAEARAMLKTLSGRTHVVHTAFAIARSGAILESSRVSSRVTFRDLAHEEVEAYVRSGEPFDKAGAYGIQGKGAGFISEVVGSRDNVMGLPVCEVLAALARYGIAHRNPGQ